MKFEFFGFLFFIWDMLVSKVALSQPQNYPSVQRLIVTTISSISPNTLTVQRILKWCLKHKQVLVKIQRKLWLSVQKKRLLNVWALLCVLHHIAHPHISLQSPHCNYGVFVSSIVNEYREFNKTKIFSEARRAEESNYGNYGTQENFDLLELRYWFRSSAISVDPIGPRK